MILNTSTKSTDASALSRKKHRQTTNKNEYETPYRKAINKYFLNKLQDKYD